MIKGNFTAICDADAIVQHPSITLEQLGKEIERQQNALSGNGVKMLFEITNIGMSGNGSKMHVVFKFEEDVTEEENKEHDLRVIPERRVYGNKREF